MGIINYMNRRGENKCKLLQVKIMKRLRTLES